MRRTHLPSVTSLMAFETAARHLSFTRAAEELHLTQGAVSHQVRQLEERIGTTLFVRAKQRISLTEAGRYYLNDIRSVLSEMSSVTQRVMAFTGRSVHVAAPTSFAIFWLAPRLKEFAQRAPDVTVNITSTFKPEDVGMLKTDATIYYGKKQWGTGIVNQLFEAESVPVCSREYYEHAALHEIGNLARVRLLHLENRSTDWLEWLTSMALPTEGAFKGPRFDQMATVKMAVVSGFGVGLLPRFVVAEELRAGALCCISDVALKSDLKYYICLPEQKLHIPAVRMFLDFLADKAVSGLGS